MTVALEMLAVLSALCSSLLSSILPIHSAGLAVTALSVGCLNVPDEISLEAVQKTKPKKW